ncbi:unnamed protein product [Cuscuta europaea]|uniref:MULE transposase domain-containing protein n=1 Tax=Cuscuta europaea TaxID=41803 RepID=A0A9P1EBN9_CUSEU|nr:unnamed protein product [Cuscuta europaea]
MGHAPKCIVTDQDPSMRIAIEKVFPNSHHRYCMWSIMSKLTRKPVFFEQFAQVIKEQKSIMLSSQQGNAHLTTKTSVIEQFCGSAAPSEVTVLPPQQARNKGCGKRFKGGKEVAIQSKKKLRLCRTCNEMCHHDSRNCPMNKSS